MKALTIVALLLASLVVFTQAFTVIDGDPGAIDAVCTDGWDVLYGNTLEDVGNVEICNNEEFLFVIITVDTGFQSGSEQIKMEIRNNGYSIDLRSGRYRFKTSTAAGEETYTFQIPFTEIGTDIDCDDDLALVIHLDVLDENGGGQTAYAGHEVNCITTQDSQELDTTGPKRWNCKIYYDSDCPDPENPPLPNQPGPEDPEDPETPSDCVSQPECPQDDPETCTGDDCPDPVTSNPCPTPTSGVNGFYQCGETAFAHGQEALQKLRLKSKRWGWYNLLENEASFNEEIYAGAARNRVSKATYVGYVTATRMNNQLMLVFQTSPGFFIKTIHAYAGTNRPTTVAPGRYGNNISFNPPIDTGIINNLIFNGNELEDDMYVILHFDVCKYQELPEESRRRRRRR